MAKLSEQQIEQAAKAWKGTSNVGIKECLRAVAPYLQLPWDEPSEAERGEIRRYICQHGEVGEREVYAVCMFINSRNAALQKPVDPRREKIVDAIHRYGYFGNKEALADNIIVALDEVK
jgi:hypothetical protein